MQMDQVRIDEQQEFRDLLLKLYDKSVMKKAKLRFIENMLDASAEKVSLDIGADNGVLSYLLRKRGGTWHSADLDPGTVASIRSLVQNNVDLIDGEHTPYADDYFDTVVIIDMLEHVHTDKEFVGELSRVMKDGGELVVNVPHSKPFSLIRKLRLSFGLTDEKHGHVRPGYTESDLRALLAPEFSVSRVETYSGFFVELVDVFISAALERMGAGAASNKGNVVTGTDLKKHEKKFKLFAMIYPFVRLAEILDRLLYHAPGHSLIARATLKKSKESKGSDSIDNQSIKGVRLD